MQSYLKSFEPIRTWKLRNNLINYGFYALFWDIGIHDDLIFAVGHPCRRHRHQARVGEHHFPALACGFGKVLTAFHMAQRWNEQTQPALWRMSSCKPARHFQSWKHLETSQQHPADPPGIKLAPAMFICSGRIGPELIPCCSRNFSHAPRYPVLTLQRTLFMWAQDY